MLNKSIVSFRLLYLKNFQNWAQATLYKVYACFWVYILFIKTRDSGGFMCHVTGIYHLGYPRGSGNFFMKLTLWMTVIEVSIISPIKSRQWNSIFPFLIFSFCSTFVLSGLPFHHCLRKRRRMNKRNLCWKKALVVIKFTFYLCF